MREVVGPLSSDEWYSFFPSTAPMIRLTDIDLCTYVIICGPHTYPSLLQSDLSSGGQHTLNLTYDVIIASEHHMISGRSLDEYTPGLQRVAGLLTREEVERWEDVELEQTLARMPDLSFCPRCQAPCLEVRFYSCASRLL